MDIPVLEYFTPIGQAHRNELRKFIEEQPFNLSSMAYLAMQHHELGTGDSSTDIIQAISESSALVKVDGSLDIGFVSWQRPKSQEYMRVWIRDLTDIGVSHFWIDELGLTPYSYNDESIYGFRTWLESETSEVERIEILGIKDLNNFNYRVAKQAGNVTPEVERAWDTYLYQSLVHFLSELVEIVQTETTIRGRQGSIGYNIHGLAETVHLLSINAADFASNELYGITEDYPNQTLLPLYRAIKDTGDGILYPESSPPITTTRIVSNGSVKDHTIKYGTTATMRTFAAEALIGQAGFRYPESIVGSWNNNSLPTNPNMVEDVEKLSVGNEVMNLVYPVFWANNHYCNQFSSKRKSNTLLVWSLEDSNYSDALFMMAGNALDDLHIQYDVAAVGNFKFRGIGSLEPNQVTGREMVILPHARRLSQKIKNNPS